MANAQWPTIVPKYKREIGKFGQILGSWETAHLPLPFSNINTYFLLREKWWLRGGVGRQFPRTKIDPKVLFSGAIRIVDHLRSERHCLDPSRNADTNIYNTQSVRSNLFFYSYQNSSQTNIPITNTSFLLIKWQGNKSKNSVNCKLHLICALFRKHAACTNKRRLRRGLGFGLKNIWRIRNVTSSKKNDIMTVSGACYSPFANRT